VIVEVNLQAWKKMVSAIGRNDFPNINFTQKNLLLGDTKEHSVREYYDNSNRQLTARMTTFNINNLPLQSSYVQKFEIEQSIVSQIQDIFLPDEQFDEMVSEKDNDWAVANLDIIRKAHQDKIDVINAARLMGKPDPPDNYDIEFKKQEINNRKNRLSRI